MDVCVLGAQECRPPRNGHERDLRQQQENYAIALMVRGGAPPPSLLTRPTGSPSLHHCGVVWCVQECVSSLLRTAEPDTAQLLHTRKWMATHVPTSHNQCLIRGHLAPARAIHQRVSSRSTICCVTSLARPHCSISPRHLPPQQQQRTVRTSGRRHRYRACRRGASSMQPRAGRAACRMVRPMRIWTVFGGALLWLSQAVQAAGGGRG